MTYETAITDIQNERERLRGYALEDLIANKSFSEVVYLILKGELPSDGHAKMMNALLVAAIDHGPGTASAQTARIAASAKNSMHTSLAAGILAMGERHGSAIEASARFFSEHCDTADLAGLLGDLKSRGVRVPGYGHPILTVDHRSEQLFELAREFGVFGDVSAFALRVHETLNATSSKPLALNIDGAMAAILLDMGFDPGVMKGVFIIARMPGLVAHVAEETANDQGIRRVSQEDIHYTGPEPRALS